jgi:hypothetical protein
MNYLPKFLLLGALLGGLACAINRELRAARRRPARTLPEAEAERRASLDDLPERQPLDPRKLDDSVAPGAPF